MPVLHDRADRHTRVQAQPERSVSDEVLYLGTVKRHHTPLQNGVPDDDVVYLGTVNRHRASDEASCAGNATIQNTAGGPPAKRRTKAQADPSSSRAPSRLKHPSHGDSISTAAPSRARRQSRAPRRQARIPPRIVDGLIEMGWSRRLDGGGRQAVYGSFSRAGRFCYWLDTAKSEPIAQKNVQYGHRFRGLTRQQVRAKVYCILEATSMDTGEV